MKNAPCTELRKGKQTKSSVHKYSTLCFLSECDINTLNKLKRRFNAASTTHKGWLHLYSSIPGTHVQYGTILRGILGPNLAALIHLIRKRPQNEAVTGWGVHVNARRQFIIYGKALHSFWKCCHLYMVHYNGVTRLTSATRKVLKLTIARSDAAGSPGRVLVQTERFPCM